MILRAFGKTVKQAAGDSTLASDDFTGSGALGANWTILGGISSMPVRTSDQLTVAAVNNETHFGCYTGITWPDNQWSKIKVITADTDGNRTVQAMCRGSISVKSCYYAEVLGPLGASATLRLARFVSGTWTSLDSTTYTVNSGDFVECRANGTTIQACINGTVVLTSTGQTDIASGNAGIGIYNDGTNINQAIGDDWSGGSL
jgi:hypothetical protein